MPEFLSNFMNDRDLIKRLLYTLFIIFIVRLTFLIPAPGVDIKALADFYNQIDIRQGYKASSMFLSGFKVKISLFSLGLMPYISACFLLQIIGALCSPLRKKYFGGEEGRRKIAAYTYVLMILIGLLQAFFIRKCLERPENFGGIRITYFTGWSFRLMITVSFVCGVAFLIWLGNLITERGIGNGIPVLILASVVSTIPGTISRIFYSLSQGQITGVSVFVKLLLYVGLFAFVVFITGSFVKVPIIYKEAINNRTEYLPLRFSMVATVPLGIASSILLLPVTLAGFHGSEILQRIGLILTPGRWVYIILYSILILFFTYIYMVVVFKPKHIKNDLEKYKAIIPDINENGTVEGYLDKIASRVCGLTGLFLIAIVVFLAIIQKIFPWPYSLSDVFNSLKFMIIIGVVYDVIRQVKAIDTMKNYPGIPRQKWECVYVAFDEIEADIRKGFLASNNIPCVVEPLKYTWGLPIRTAIDQYRLYVPGSQCEEAVKEIQESCRKLS